MRALDAADSQWSWNFQNHSSGVSMVVQSYRDLIAWQRAYELAQEIYRLTGLFPIDERYAMSQQLRKSAVSIAGNIAEGSGRYTSRDFLNFLSNSRGSTKETESHLLISVGVGLTTESQASRALHLTDEISRLLHSLRGSIRRRGGRKAGD
jgi:four helix bundle protein